MWLSRPKFGYELPKLPHMIGITVLRERTIVLMVRNKKTKIEFGGDEQ